MGDIDLMDEVVVKDVGDEEQTLDVYALGVENAIEIGAGAMYLAGKDGIRDARLVKFLFDEWPDVDVFVCPVFHIPYFIYAHKKAGADCPVYLSSGIAKHHCRK